MKFINWIKGVLSPESRVFWILLTVAVPAIPAIGLTISGVYSQEFQNWLIGIEDNREHGSTTIRNLGLIVAGLVALPLATWRGYVAHRQADATHRQADIAQQQMDAVQRGLRNERYQKGADMLGSDVPSVRMGGIYALQLLAEEYPEEYHIQIMRLFCAFVRSPTSDKVYEDQIKKEDLAPLAREDVEAVMRAIGMRNETRIALEREVKFHLELQNANLHRMDLYGANLSGALFYGTDLSEAVLRGADLSNADLRDANLTRAELRLADLSNTDLRSANLSDAELGFANLSNAHLKEADISWARFFGVTGLTQKQLDQARVAIGFNQPKLEGALDAKTRENLKWRRGLRALLEDEE